MIDWQDQLILPATGAVEGLDRSLEQDGLVSDLESTDSDSEPNSEIE
jgi:hypothetical protein